MGSGSTAYPGGDDTFTIPSDPENTPTSSAGDGTRDLPQSIADEGAAIMALEANAAQKPHTHSGGSDGTVILRQSSTHANADTDTSNTSIHHTIGPGAHQASAGNHTHNYNSLTGDPLIICTSVNRPPSPFVGQMIFETDTGVWRQWYAYSTPSPVWQILPMGRVPNFRAEAQTVQAVLREESHALSLTTIIQDFFWGIFGIAQFMVTDVSATDIVIPEPGTYHVHASICWDPSNTYQDQSSVQVTVNGADVGRKNWEWVRGPVNPYSGTAGFSQTNEIEFYYPFQAGDVLRVIAEHNAQETSFLWYNPNPPVRQVCFVECMFHSP